MLLFAILAIITVILLVVGVAIVSAVGAAGILVFGDVIVCIALIAMITHFIIKAKKKK